MAEALTRYRLHRAGIDATVESRGLLPPGRPMPEPAQLAMGRRGIDVANYRSMQLDVTDVRDAGLVLGMERRHVREVVLRDGSARTRAFTLRDFTERALAFGPRVDMPFDEWVTAVSGERTMADLLGDGTPDELPDPMGLSPEMFEAVARELEDHIEHLIWLAFGGPRPAGPPVEPVAATRPPAPAFGRPLLRRWGPGRPQERG